MTKKELLCNMKTLHEFLEEAREELGHDFNGLEASFENEYYELVVKEVEDGRQISKAVYDSLPEMKKFHFNKHYNYRGDKVHNTDLTETVTEETTTVNYVIEAAQSTTNTSTAYNRTFSTYREAYNQCISCDFDPASIEQQPMQDSKCVDVTTANSKIVTEQKSQSYITTKARLKADRLAKEKVEREKKQRQHEQEKTEKKRCKATTQEVKMVRFYWRFGNGQWQEAEGEKMVIEGITVYGAILNGGYTLTEEQTGVSMGGVKKNKTEAIEYMNNNIDRVGIDALKMQITKMVEKNGISPLYKTVS